MKRRNKTIFDKDGSSIDDPFLSYIKGYSRLEAASRDSMGLFNETMFIRNSLFPLRDVPVSDRPGYITHERDYFSFECDNLTIKEDLEKYFTDKYSRYRDNLYGNGDDLGGFLNMIAYQLMVTGISFYRTCWDEIDVKSNKYVLPVDFDYLRDSTMKIKKRNGHIAEYLQKYSIITYYFTNKNYFKGYGDKEIPRKVSFLPEEVFYCKYPISSDSPAKASLKYLKQIKKFWDFGLDKAKSGADPDDHALSVEKTRYVAYADENRKYDLAKSKIRTIFHYLTEGNNLKMTQYYDVYRVMRYKKFLNTMRSYLIHEFNRQVMKVVAKKNNFDSVPKLRYDGFLTNKELDAAFDAYKKGELSFDVLIESAIKKA